MAALLAVGPAGALAQQVTVADPSPNDFDPPRPPPPVRHLYLGASITTNSPDWDQALHRSEAKGALVLLVVPASPAELTGLVPGDVIVAVDGHTIGSDEQLVTSIRAPVADDVPMTVLNPDGGRRTVYAHLEPRGDRTQADAEESAGDTPSPADRLLYARSQPDPKIAISVLDQLIDTLPSFAAAHALRAQRLLELAISERDRFPDRAAAVRAAVDHATELEPASLQVQTTAARVLATLGDGTGAERHATQAVAIDDQSALAHLLLGQVRLARQRPAEALPDLHRAVVLDPYAEDAYRALSGCYTALGKPRLAEDTDRALAAVTVGAAGSSTLVTAPGQPLKVAVAALAALAVGGLLPLARRRRLADTVADRPPEGPAPPPGRPGMWAVEALAGLALFSVALPAVGQPLALSPGGLLRTEILDHAVPGVAILVLCVLAMRLLFRGEQSSDSFLMVAIGIVLAGLWMAATHVALVGEVFRGRTTAEVAVVHCLPGPAAMVLGVLLYRAHAHPPAPTTTPPRVHKPATQPTRRPPSKRKHR